MKKFQEWLKENVEKRVVKSIQGRYHTTATEKRGIIAGLDANQTHWKVGRKIYQIIQDDGASMVIRITDKEKNDYGVPVEKHQDHIVTFK